ncbi:MAG: Ni/Fe-hydrogenase cytochrome b subunit [Thermoanaerobaculales bacterium]|nr:Ni/Fe-hydrogenase cytochrome b subunit [Thermoanaerobaculales bacterium]
MTKFTIPRITFWRCITVLLAVLVAGIVVRRFTFGLGSISNLHDGMPWGLWIGFDLLCGVALAAGGFTITAIVFVFHLEKYKVLVRPTILTAFLGYLIVIGALLVDLGRPWNIWHPIVFWNPHSVMFEVGWCVMLYTTVLFMEFLPFVLERFGIHKPLRLWHRYLTPVLVLAGVLLSTMHQSSLGTLYVIAPQKLHPFWYSQALPILFFVSAIPLGLAMVSVESYLSLRAFGKRLHPEILRDVGKATAVMLMFYLTIRIEDIIVRGEFGNIFAFDAASWFFLAEFVIGGLVPMFLLFRRDIRENSLALMGTQTLVVLGMIFNRMNVTVTGFQLGTGASYIPSWMEFVLSIGMVCIGMILFSFAVRNLPVFEEGPLEDPRPTDPIAEMTR